MTFKLQQTFGELFWDNVDEKLKENKKTLKDVARFMESDDKKSEALYHRMYRSRSERTNPSNIIGQGIYNYLKQFDEFLTVGYMYDVLKEEDE